MRSSSSALGLAVAMATLVTLSTLSATAPSSPAGAATVKSHGKGKAIVKRTPLLDSLIASGRIEVLEHYGTGSLLVRGEETDLSVAETAGRGHRRRVEDRILLRARMIDTSQPAAAGSAATSATTGQRLELLQFHGPVKTAWLDELRAGGVRPIAYLPHNAYIVWVEDPRSLSASGLPIQWRGPLVTTDRLSPELASTPGPVDLTVQVARTGAHRASIERIRSRATAILMEPHDLGMVTSRRVTMPRADIDEIARLAEVVWIEPFEPVLLHDERSDLITAGQVARSRVLGPGYLSWLAAHGLDDLSAAIVDVTDTGIDTGGTNIVQPGLRGRIAYSDDMTSEGRLDDCAGHGTNIAGIIAGGITTGAEILDGDGYLLGLGIAPTARIGASRIFDCAGHFAPAVSFTELVANAWRHGARIGNNSWGGSGAQYNSISAEYDALVRDADNDPSNGDQGFLPVFSSGNFGPSTLTVGWPANAKNVLSVGATESYRVEGSDGCGTTNIQADSVDHVLSFSSRGPTADGRFKPDLVAPGSHIQSLASTSASYTGVGVCDSYYPPGQHLLNWSSGTSQAAAHATGAAVIASEVFRREFGAQPSPAMLKAMLINHAHDMGTTVATPSNTSSRPNFSQGWGRADVGALTEERARVAFDQKHVMTATGETFVLDPIVPEDPNRPVIVTLTWTDAPGTPAGWSFVNDLDLVVEADAVVYLGNVLDHGVSITGGSADARNNVEIVVLPPGSHSLRVTVEAANLPGDGVPSAPGETDQDFALYASNARLATDDGLIAFGRPAAVCGSVLPLRLADRQLRGFGTTQATVSSGLDSESLSMREDPAGSGVFSGVLDVSAGAAVAGDGVLQASDSQTVLASYSRLAVGTGTPRTNTATTVARCAAPVITQAQVTLVGDSEATIRWKTDRPADSVVSFGPGSTRTLLHSDPKLVTDHAVRLQGLAGCALHTAVVSSTDAGGLTGTGPASPLRFSTGSGVNGRRIVFQDDMESLGSRWSHGPAAAGAVDDWELGHPATAPPGAFSGRRVWGTNLDGNYSNGADALLTSPPIDLRDVLGAHLTFMHYYAISGGRPPNSLNDGAWVEVSGDGGATWTPIDPIGGYPDTLDEDNPYLSTTSGVYAGSLAGWVKTTFDLASFSGQLVQVRFRLWQDSTEGQPLSAGWYIDDVEVRAEGNCHQGRLALDADDYGCASRVTVLLSDSDMNIGPLIPDAATVIASSALGQIPLSLSETGPSSGQFRATLDLSPAATPGKLAVAEGGVVTFSYADANTGDGTPGMITASAMVSDCTPPPAPAGVSATSIAAGALSVTWTPVDPSTAPDLQGYRVYYDTDGSGPVYSGSAAFQGISPLRVEAAPTAMTLTALGGCSPHFITVTAFDRLGNESAYGPESIAVPDGASPCATARLSAYPATPGCLQTVSISLSDANADSDHSSIGAVTVSATGPSHPGPLTVTLTESSPASGVFIGPMLLSPTAQPGALTTAEGDLVTLQYQDADDGRGQTRTTSATVRVSDCTPPAISDVTVTSRSDNRATVRWTTDEPASSTVSYGLDPSLGLGATTPGLTRQHAVSITDLPACSPVYYAISSADARGNTSTAGGGGSPLHFGSYREVRVFADDLESGAPGWTHRGFPAGNDRWELGPPVPGVSGGPPSASSGAAVWGTDLDGSYPDGSDMVLVSPPMDLRSAQAATLTFRHWYDIWTSGPPNGFDDGAFVEVSIDDGATWTYIIPTGGYPDRISGNPYMPFGAGGFSGRNGGWDLASFVLDAWVGHVVRVRFHLFEDPGEISPEPHAGWYIDDVVLSRAVACHDALLEMDRAVYACDGAAATLRLFDVDLDTDPLSPDTAAVRVSSDAEPSGETFQLSETGPSTGLFEATVPIASHDGPGVIAVRQDDTLVASYDDADDGTGASRVATAIAHVPDCTPPVISGFRLADITHDSFRVEWSTTEAGDSRVLFGDTPALGGLVVVPGSRTTHSITVSGLPACTKHFFTVASTDGQGNLAREDTTSGLRQIISGSPIDLMSEGFENGAPGWEHRGGGDTWRFVASGAGAAVTAPAGSYPRPTGGTNADFVLQTPLVNLVGVTHPVLTVRHAYDFPSSFQGGDGGWVEGWNGASWATLTPSGGYPAFIDPEAGRTGSRLPAYSGRSAGQVVSLFDLTELAAAVASNGGSETRIRFHVFVEDGSGPTGAGWTIHDAAIAGDVACRSGRLAFDRAALTCASSTVGLTLHDRDLDLDSGTIDAATVTLSSSGGPAPLAVTLLETSPASGNFRGMAPLSRAGAPGTLRSEPGDRISASYSDVDDGSGTPATVFIEAPVRACAGPVIDRVSLTPAGDGFVARWATDRPATSELMLQPAAGPSLAASDHRLVTSHQLVVTGAVPCAAYTATIASEDTDGLRGTAGNPGVLVAENTDRRIMFADNMEGGDPGWSLSGLHVEWQRGVPLFGPPSAFSGQKVFATDLTGRYDGGTNSTLTSPSIDLTGVTSARLTFWHWYDIFADTPPNSTDDSAWVEVQVAGIFNPIYIQPIGGYPDTTDAESGEPLIEGTAVYAGQSEDWEKATFDLTPFAGQIIKLRFRLWNDFIELLINGQTGAGWYIDDVEVSSPRFCHPAPLVTSPPLGSITQGSSRSGLTLDGSGFRAGARVALGPGVGVSAPVVGSSTRVVFDVSVDPRAVLGPRDLTLLNPDGQMSILPAALTVAFDPSKADTDGSGRVDGGDLAALAAAFGAAEGESRYRLAADLNGDGFVDGLDLALLAVSFGVTF